jgi:hypothetical protein
MYKFHTIKDDIKHRPQKPLAPSSSFICTPCLEKKYKYVALTYRITRACMSPITSGIPPENLLPSSDLSITKLSENKPLEKVDHGRFFLIY